MDSCWLETTQIPNIFQRNFGLITYSKISTDKIYWYVNVSGIKITFVPNSSRSQDMGYGVFVSIWLRMWDMGYGLGYGLWSVLSRRWCSHFFCPRHQFGSDIAWPTVLFLTSSIDKWRFCSTEAAESNESASTSQKGMAWLGMQELTQVEVWADILPLVHPSQVPQGGSKADKPDSKWSECPTHS